MKRLTSFAVLVVLAIQAIGCKKNEALNRPLAEQSKVQARLLNFLELLENETLARDIPDAAARAQLAHKATSETLRATMYTYALPEIIGRLDISSPAKAKKFIAANAGGILVWLNVANNNEATAALMQSISEISKEAAASRDARVTIRDYALLYVVLQDIRLQYVHLTELAMPLLNALGPGGLDSIPEVVEFREQLQSAHMSNVRMLIVLGRNLSETIRVIQQYKDAGMIPENILRILNNKFPTDAT